MRPAARQELAAHAVGRHAVGVFGTPSAAW
jgi:hypothetical protein